MVSLFVQGQPAKESAAILPANLLGPAYVDLRNGFSVRPPRIYSVGSTPGDGLPDLIDWPQLKLPASKCLVSFRHPDGVQRLTVYLLVTRKEMTIESILEARQSYWQTFPDQATLKETTTETVSSFPAAVTHLLWKGKNQDHQVRLRETLIQRKKNRYFMLVQVGALPEAEGDAEVILDETIAGNFVCMEESEIKQRWSKARQAARKILEPLDSAAVKSKLSDGDQIFYRLRRDGQEVGFSCVRRKLHVLADQKQHRFEIDTLVYANSGEAAQAYAELIGWRACPLVANEGKPAYIGPVRLESHFQLDGSLKTERFEFHATDGQQPPNVYCEKGEWQEKRISIYPCQTGPENEGAGVEQLKITSKIEKIYLPLSLVDVLGQFIEPVIGKEYVFARYFYRTLGFYSLRVVEKVELKLKRLPVETAKGEATTKTEPAGEQVKTLYLVGRLNSQGPIIELWLDEKGQILVQKTPEIELVRANQAEIAQRWPKELAKLLPDVVLKKATTK